MKSYAYIRSLLLLLVLAVAASCDHIDNKAVPGFAVRIDLGNYALWNTYGVNGMGDYRIFNREKGLPANFPYNINTYTGYGGVLLMMGIDAPLAYDLACPVEQSQNITLSINADNYEAVCPSCGSHFNPLTGMGGPVSGVAINNKLGMRVYRVTPTGGGYMISN
ncbi:MAG: hypothetical protein IJV05_09115 [Muribaculaceae bacterium]|nr:hypothetical protein [Muribaculaceae bacterium]